MLGTGEHFGHFTPEHTTDIDTVYGCCTVFWWWSSFFVVRVGRQCVETDSKEDGTGGNWRRLGNELRAVAVATHLLVCQIFSLHFWATVLSQLWRWQD